MIMVCSSDFSGESGDEEGGERRERGQEVRRVAVAGGSGVRTMNQGGGNQNALVRDGGVDVDVEANVDVREGEERENNGLEPVLRKMKDPSPCWNFFEKQDNTAKCTLCNTVVGRIDTTSNMFNHLYVRHKNNPQIIQLKKDVEGLKRKRQEEKEEREKKKVKTGRQTTLLNFAKKGNPNPAKHKRMDDALVKWTTCNNMAFDQVESHFFRNFVFQADPSYICPGRKTHTKRFDDAAVKVKEMIKNDIVDDLVKAGHKTLTCVSDHGTSDDMKKTSKNVVVVHRGTKDFKIRANIVEMIRAEGRQTASKIKSDVKQTLEVGAGLQPDWLVNWVGDGEPKQVCARDPDKNRDVQLNIVYHASCTDHTLELASEDTLKERALMGLSLKKLRKLINHFKDSHLAREALEEIIKRSGQKPLAIMQGTDNRWFYKYSEAKRALELRESLETWFQEYNAPASLEKLDEEDWERILAYQNAMKVVVESATVLEGLYYPTASSVIPFLAATHAELEQLAEKLTNEEHRLYVETLIRNLERRFPDGRRLDPPFNVLNLLDARFGHVFTSSLSWHCPLR